jgi:hypothetical protein
MFKKQPDNSKGKNAVESANNNRSHCGADAA